MAETLTDILELFTIEDVGGGSFLGRQPDGRDRVRVYGGQVVAQAMMAAARSAPTRQIHSLHVAFLRPGNPASPLQYDVTTLREGRTFSTRRVSTSQAGVLIMEAMISFIEKIDGDDYQHPMPDVPAPETLIPIADALKPYADEEYSTLVRNQAFEMRYVDLPPRISVDGQPPAVAVCRLWLRADGEVPAEVRDDPLLANCLLAYVSDWSILDPVQIGVGKTWQTLDAMASLDHAMWFHRPVDFSDWLLYDQQSPSAIGGRGLGCGAIYNRTGALVCTVTQEGYLGRLKRRS
ncbi:thioesterase family protein [Mycolicibacterium komossense]|uniref:Thioesterase family protein n=1 Tax=Mycolicibacterium komossense TaxID=1779 RepID=A0ABT3CD20_9MYCO|nr:thioesterase family protein [Mycolicibacterium komossense]